MNIAIPKKDAGWTTYLKAAAFLLPALVLWTLTAIFIVPKLQQICADAGGQPLPAFIQAVLALTDHGVLFLLLVAAVIVVLEWFSENWVRYRRIVTGFAVFLLNTVILSSFFALLITFAMVAPALMNIGR
jgi:hypothetical protein